MTVYRRNWEVTTATPLLCRFGIHDWRTWTYRKTFSGIGALPSFEDNVDARECRRCSRREESWPPEGFGDGWREVSV